MLARLVVHSKFDFVGFIDFDGVVFRLPPIRAGGSRSGHHIVLYLHGYECFGTSREPAQGGVIDVLHGNNSNGQLAGERFPQVRHVD